MPSVSVIIPTHNRRVALRRTLDALAIQTYPLQQMEVLVVADGCADDTIQMLQGYTGPLALRVLEQSSQGAGVARNRGASCAAGELLVFLDDDIEATTGLIEAHVSAHKRRPGHVVIGYLPLILAPRANFFNIELRTWWEAMFDIMRRPGHRYTYRNLLSGNFSLEARIFKTVGGFDASFRVHEDYELGLRLIKGNIPFLFVPEAMGYHYEETDLGRSLERKFEEGIADVLLCRRHPELCPVLPLAYFSSFSRITRFLGIFAFQGARISNGFVALLRFVLQTLEKIRYRRRWRQILEGLLGYYYWLGVARELGTRKALHDFLKEKGPSPGKGSAEIEIDLQEGLQTAERRLDQERPVGAYIRYGQRFVGHIPPQVGAERLRGAHLRPMLANHFSKHLVKVLALEGQIESWVDRDQLFEVCGLTHLEPVYRDKRR